MGHATRSQVVIESLLERHDVHVVASGAAFNYLSGVLPLVSEIMGAKFVMEDGEIRRWATVRRNVHDIGAGAPHSLRNWLEMMRDWKPEVVVTDFEPLAARYARVTRTPLVAVDNINMLDRCKHDSAIYDGHREDFSIARAVTRSMVPNAVNYLGHHVLLPADREGPDEARPLDPAQGDRRRRSRGRRSPARLLERRGERPRGAPGQRDAVPRLRHARRTGRGHRGREPRVQAALERGLRRGPAHRPRRDRRRRVLADERGGLPRQADAGDAAARPVRAADELALPGARGLRRLDDGAHARDPRPLPRRDSTGSRSG